MGLKFTQQMGITETSEKSGFAYLVSRAKSINHQTLSLVRTQMCESTLDVCGQLYPP